MRLVPARTTAVLATTALAIGLLGATAPAGQASASHASPRPRGVRLVTGRDGLARGVATARTGTITKTGSISGLVRTPAGAPLAGACLTATGPAGITAATSAADGRYRFPGLQPGSYRVRLAECPDPADQPFTSASWPHLPSAVIVRAGRTAALPPAIAWPTPRPNSGTWQPARATASPLVSKTTGSIAGTVTGAGRRLGGICVSAFGANSGATDEADTTTTKSGRYLIRHLRPGRYDVIFATMAPNPGQSGPRCPNLGNWLQQWYPDVNTTEPTHKTVQVVVRAGQHRGQINASLQHGGEISGTIRSAAGKPLSGICILYGSGTNLAFGFGAVASSHDGRYRLPGLFNGRYRLEFKIGCGNDGNYAFQWWRNENSYSHANSIKVVRPRVIKGIDVKLARGAELTGTVRGGSRTGKRVSGVCIFAISSNGDSALIKTPRTGNFVLKGLGTSDYQVVFDSSCGSSKRTPYLFKVQAFKLTAGHTRRAGNIVLTTGARLTGVVTDSQGNPLKGACVEVQDDDFNSASTGPNGGYSVIGIDPGKHAVRFGGCDTAQSVTPQFYGNQPTADQGDRIKFKAGKTVSGVNAALQPGGTLTGVVTDRAGHKLAHICVGAVAIGASDEIPSGFQAMASTRRDGTYRLRNIPPGPYQVSIGCYGAKYADQWFNHQQDSSAGSLLSIPPGLTTNLDGTVSRPGSITGTVTDASGRPLDNICVQLADPAAKTFVNIEDSQTLTGERGRYRISGLTPGRYLVQFSSCGEGSHATRWYGNATTPATAKAAVVHSGQLTTGINQVLRQGGQITGTVTGPSGQPVPDICVNAFDSTSLSFQFTGTDKSGRYDLNALASGHYSITFGPCTPKGPNLGVVSRPSPVLVTGTKTTTGIDVQLKVGGTITGRMLGGADGKTPQRDTCVISVPQSPGGSVQSAETDHNGRYVLTDIAPGKYQVYFGDVYCVSIDDSIDFDGPEFEATEAPQWFRDQPAQAAAATITVSSGHATTGIDATMHPFGTITGTVRAASGQAVSGECVTAVPTTVTPEPFFGAVVPDVTAITSASGRYALIDLPGQYKLKFSANCGSSGLATQWWQNAPSAKTATPVTIAYGTTGGIDATLQP